MKLAGRHPAQHLRDGLGRTRPLLGAGSPRSFRTSRRRLSTLSSECTAQAARRTTMLRYVIERFPEEGRKRMMGK